MCLLNRIFPADIPFGMFGSWSIVANAHTICSVDICVSISLQHYHANWIL